MRMRYILPSSAFMPFFLSVKVAMVGVVEPRGGRWGRGNLKGGCKSYSRGSARNGGGVDGVKVRWYLVAQMVSPTLPLFFSSSYIEYIEYIEAHGLIFFPLIFLFLFSFILD